MDDNAGVFVISVAAELAGMHPQTLRQYDRLGIVSPERTSGRGRRYSQSDIRRLREVQRLSQKEGVNLEGIRQIMALRAQVVELETEVARLQETLEQVRVMSEQARRVFAAGASGGDVVAVAPGARPRRRGPGSALMVWRPLRALESRRPNR